LPLSPLSVIAVLSKASRKGVEMPVRSSLAPLGPA